MRLQVLDLSTLCAACWRGEGVARAACVLATCLAMACERGGEAPHEQSPVTYQGAPHALQEADQGLEGASFEQGSRAQQDLMLAALTHTLDGKKAQRIEAFMRLFYSEPVSAPQLKAGHELLEDLEALGQLEQAAQVARDLHDLELPALYSMATRVKLADYHARRADASNDLAEGARAEAIKLYEEVLASDAEQLFVYIAIMNTTRDEEERATTQARYLRRRQELLDAMDAPGTGPERRAEILERLVMVEDEPDGRQRALFQREVERAGETPLSRLLRAWLEEERASQQGEGGASGGEETEPREE